MKDSSRKAMFAKGKIPNNAPASTKYCSRCGGIHNSSKAKSNGFFDLPLCNKCNTKGLKPLGHPPHWVWNKLSIKDKENALKKTKENIVYDPKNPNALKIYSNADYDDLPYSARQQLRKAWGIESE